MSALEPVCELAGHTDRVWSVAWSPDGQRLASCSGDRTLRVWSRTQPVVTSGSMQAEEWICTSILEDAQTRTLRSCAWAPNGRFIAVASFDATTAIWEVDGGVWQQVALLEGHENEVKCVAWSPDGSFLSTCGRDKSVWIWESIPGNEYECVDVKQGHSQDVKCVAWHPSGEVLASASYDDTIRLWVNDGDEWTCAQVLGGPNSGGLGHTSTVWAISFEPSGDHMVSVSDDRTVRIWSCRQRAAAGTEVGPSESARCTPPWRLACTLSGHHERAVYCCDWGPAGMVAAGDGNNEIKVYTRSAEDVDACSTCSVGGQQHWALVASAPEAHSQDVNCVRWHPSDTSLLASAGDDGKIKLWRCSRGPGAEQMHLG